MARRESQKRRRVPAREPEPGHRTGCAAFAGQAVEPCAILACGPLNPRSNSVPPEKVKLCLLDLAESGREPGFQGKPAQDPRAEGVDRLDAQATGRFQSAGEEGSGVAQCLFLIRLRLAPLQRGKLGCQRIAIHHRPFAQSFEQAGDHLVGGCAGIGNAKYGIRRRAIEQQPCHTVDQDLCLARPGIRRHPGRMRGIGGLIL